MPPPDGETGAGGQRQAPTAPGTERQFRGIWISAALWQRRDIGTLEKVLAAEVDSLDSLAHGCVASNAYFAEFFGVSERRVQGALQTLKEVGLVEEAGFDGRTRRLRSLLRKAGGTPPPPTQSVRGRHEEKFTPEVKETAPRFSKDNIIGDSLSSPPAPPAGLREGGEGETPPLAPGWDTMGKARKAPAKPKRVPTAGGLALARWFNGKLPSTVARPKNWEWPWAFTFEDVMRKHGATAAEVQAVVGWALDDDYWSTRLDDPTVLRRNLRSGVATYLWLRGKMQRSAANTKPTTNNEHAEGW